MTQQEIVNGYSVTQEDVINGIDSMHNNDISVNSDSLLEFLLDKVEEDLNNSSIRGNSELRHKIVSQIDIYLD